MPDDNIAHLPNKDEFIKTHTKTSLEFMQEARRYRITWIFTVWFIYGLYAFFTNHINGILPGVAFFIGGILIAVLLGPLIAIIFDASHYFLRNRFFYLLGWVGQIIGTWLVANAFLRLVNLM